MYEKIVEMMCEQFDLTPDAISTETSFVDDLGIDSLDVVELVMELEDAFQLDEIPEEELKKMRTVGDLVEYVNTHSDT
jgi:acyl carrier protein